MPGTHPGMWSGGVLEFIARWAGSSSGLSLPGTTMKMLHGAEHAKDCELPRCKCTCSVPNDAGVPPTYTPSLRMGCVDLARPPPPVSPAHLSSPGRQKRVGEGGHVSVGGGWD